MKKVFFFLVYAVCFETLANSKNVKVSGAVSANKLHCEPLNVSTSLEDLISIVNFESCDLVDKLLDSERSLDVERNPNSLEKHPEGLSKYWAQEYTGAYLVRERLSLEGIEMFNPSIVQVWDSSIKWNGRSTGHGDEVASLISSPFKSATIPAKNRIVHRGMNSSLSYSKAYEQVLADCRNQKNCPQIINNSMSWGDDRDSSLINSIVSKLSERNIIFVHAVGNSAMPLNKRLKGISENVMGIQVANLSPTGGGASDTNFGHQVTISAPSDFFLRSQTQEGETNKFGGTSGSAPLVTGALAAFELITGNSLSTNEAKKLLKMTAIKIPYPDKHALGAGMLNSYRIAEIGFKLKELCGNSKTCQAQKLAGNEIYITKKESSEIIEKAKSAFPICNSNNNVTRILSCEEKRMIFKQLHSFALLDSENSKIWSLLSCISLQDNLNENAKFYKSLSDLPNMSDEDLLAKMKSDEVIKFLLTQPDWFKRQDVLDKIVKTGNFDSIVLKYLFKLPEWKRIDLLTSIIERGKASDEVGEVLLMDNYWSSHPEILSLLIKSKSKLGDKAQDIDGLIEILLEKQNWQNAYRRRIQLNRKVTIKDVKLYAK